MTTRDFFDRFLIVGLYVVAIYAGVAWMVAGKPCATLVDRQSQGGFSAKHMPACPPVDAQSAKR